MSQRPKGMVMLMALIMLTMLGLMSASALRGTGISALDVGWQSDAILVEEIVERHLRHAARNFAASRTRIDSIVMYTPSGVRTQTTMTLFESRPETESWPAGICAEFRTEGARGLVTDVQTIMICLPGDPDHRSKLIAWRGAAE